MDPLLIAQVLLTTLDWHQTREIAANPNTFHEVNPILSQHPSAGRVNAHFLTTETIIVGGSQLFPSYHNQILGASVVAETLVVGRNSLKVGLKLEF